MSDPEGLKSRKCPILGIYFAWLQYDHAEAQHTLRIHFTIMFRVQQGLGKFHNDTVGPGFVHITNSVLQSKCHFLFY